MKITKNFSIKELVHPSFIEEYGEAKMVRVVKRYAPLMLLGLEQLKTFLFNATVTINDYEWNDNNPYINSGVRSHRQPLPGSSLLSAHYFMQATDCKFGGYTVQDVYKEILDNQDEHPYIVRMEHIDSTPTWLHIQWGYRLPGQDIIVFKP